MSGQPGFIFAANWKMHKTPDESETFLSEFAQILKAQVLDDNQLIVFPPALLLDRMVSVRQKHPTLSKVQLGLQNCYSQIEGAFTGENSAAVGLKMGASWVLVGHSERRTLFQESDENIASKVSFILRQFPSLKVMLCVGESLEQRDAGQTLTVLQSQWKAAEQKLLSSGLDLSDLQSRLVIAYEPVWAIGTGRVANTDQVQQAHEHLKEITSGLQIVYGGSVKADNAGKLSQVPGVDGFLVGGASLQAKSFWELISQSL